MTRVVWIAKSDRSARIYDMVSRISQEFTNYPEGAKGMRRKVAFLRLPCFDNIRTEILKIPSQILGWTNGRIGQAFEIGFSKLNLSNRPPPFP